MKLFIAASALLAQAAPAPVDQPQLPTVAEVRAATRKPVPPMTADPRVAAEIRSLERRWGKAFVERDFAFLESIVAPQFRLASGRPDGAIIVTSRADWMRNSRAFQHLGFRERVVDVMSAGDTAVALVEVEWTVKQYADRPAGANPALVTDTWVRRGGKWQVVYRYSHRLPDAKWPWMQKAESAR
jgi:hypothetical protein